MEKNFLSFLENALPNAAKCAKQMEQIFFIDSSSAMAKARLFIEELVNSIWELEQLNKFDNRKLSEKINYLYNKGFIDKEIFQSFDVIRRAGNSASHNANFNEMSLAYSVHKEMYIIAKWYFEIYTHENITLPVYEQPQVPSITENLEEKVKSLLENYLNNKNVASEEVAATQLIENLVHEEINEQILQPLDGNIDSYLVREISRLSISSAEAVESANSFSKFKNYLHIKRPIQEKLEEVLESRVKAGKSNLILLCGSVGDGKSHLLAYLNHQRKDLMEQYRIFNDATESFSPSKTALETLEEVLKNFSDQHFEEKEEKIIIAINMGVLNNFINREHHRFTYNKLKQFIEKSELFTDEISTHVASGPFDLISFTDYQMYELTPSGAESSYFSNLIKKICDPNIQNPFYQAFKKDFKEERTSIIHENFKFLSDEFVQQQIVQLVVQVMIQYKHNVSSRHFLNLIADILIPPNYKMSENYNEYEKLEQTLPSLLFNSKGRSQLLDYVSWLNPMNFRVQRIDELLVTLNTLTDWSNLIDENISNEVARSWLIPFTNEVNLINEVFEQLITQLVITKYLIDESFAKDCSNEVYNNYLEYLYNFNKNQKRKIKEFYKHLKTAIFNWKGTPINEHIYLSRLENNFAIAQKLRLNPPNLDVTEERSEIKFQIFKPTIRVKYFNNEKTKSEELDIDFSLFQLLFKVEKGYRPNKKDEEGATTFVEFLEKLMEFGNKKNKLIFDLIAENKKYRLTVDEFQDQGFVFEKVE